jgi:hypothetical protein
MTSNMGKIDQRNLARGPGCRANLCPHAPIVTLQQNNGGFGQQTGYLIKRWRLKLAKEIAWLPSFVSGNFC